MQIADSGAVGRLRKGLPGVSVVRVDSACRAATGLSTGSLAVAPRLVCVGLEEKGIEHG